MALNESDTESDAGSTPTAQLAAMVADLSFATIPSAAIDTVERCFVDTVAVALAGTATGAGRIATDAVRRRGTETGTATVFASDIRVSPTDASFVNGTAAHSLDFDDVSDAIVGHPSTCLVPAILSLVEETNARGEDVITAYVAGFETAAAIAAPIVPAHYERGWHATATFGTFGAAAAAASILDLDEPAVGNALTIAASMAAGLKRNFGSMVKPMHAGQAARSGVTAALVAAEGIDTVDDAIAGPGGFLDLYGGDATGADLEIHPPQTGETLVEMGIDIKKYPCCYFTHAAIEAAIMLKQNQSLDPGVIESVSVTASQGAADALPHENPTTGGEARFSMQYTVSNALVYGDVGPHAFDGDRLTDPTITALSERVTLEVDKTLPYQSYQTQVTIRTRDGAEATQTVSDPPGNHDHPLTDAELEEKFVMCAGVVIDDPSRIADSYAYLSSLSNKTDVSTLFTAI